MSKDRRRSAPNITFQMFIPYICASFFTSHILDVYMLCISFNLWMYITHKFTICRIVCIYIYTYISHPETFKNPHSPVSPSPRPPDPPDPPPGDLLQSPASASRLDPNPWVLGARSHCLGNLLLEDSVPCFCGAWGMASPWFAWKKSDEASDSWLIY